MEDLKQKRQRSPEEERLLRPDFPQTGAAHDPFPGLPATSLPCRFQIFSPHNCVNQFLSLSLCLSPDKGILNVSPWVDCAELGFL